MKNDWSPPKMGVRGPIRQPEGCLAHPPRARQAPSWMPGGPPLAYITPCGNNPRTSGVSEFRRRLVAETYREEKAISGGQTPPGRSPPEGEIIVIVTCIIEIIINITPNISTISISIPSHLTIPTCVVICTIYPLYSVGVFTTLW